MVCCTAPWLDAVWIAARLFSAWPVVPSACVAMSLMICKDLLRHSTLCYAAVLALLLFLYSEERWYHARELTSCWPLGWVSIYAAGVLAGIVGCSS
jgi:hypothetical protein